MLDEIQTNGQEEQFYEQMRAELKPLMMQTPNWEYFIPILGKAMKAVNVLIDSNSIDEFKQTKDYRYVHDFGFDGNFFNGEFDLFPVKGYKKMIASVMYVLLFIMEWLALRIFGNTS